MDLRFVPPDLRRIDDVCVDEVGVELVACSMWHDERPMRGLAGLLDWRMCGRLSRLAREAFIDGTAGELLCVPGRPRLPFDKVLVVGLGTRAAFDDQAFRAAVVRLARALEGLHVKRAVVELPGRFEAAIEPERATEILLEQVGDDGAHDAWWLVENADAQQRIVARAQDERRRVRRA